MWPEGPWVPAQSKSSCTIENWPCVAHAFLLCHNHVKFKCKVVVGNHTIMCSLKIGLWLYWVEIFLLCVEWKWMNKWIIKILQHCDTQWKYQIFTILRCLKGGRGSQIGGSWKLVSWCFLTEYNEIYQLLFTSSKNIDPKQSYCT